ncbi:uncharacterized protein LOC127262443 isoform X2 [Andrographis paniculata]|uniref:uncharacterized protein LOC127262443 isoform X1 n=1 Tax=Andrographis paniculata TaxID=175694 RepID=UPI0021E93E3C|nr:uncharacterized protein LOC127262443 isoform X1 [Andrographis paniculata]XP_051147075.1 uncharacterized protein LOC127262443 isoform X1 [Andrographis paniculata]XP_051147076.1 uncharacterized protein LOC127262443 isoform X1 [Andrographis paniculata]XP_051147077.1 uncharacterized protein LOC127262443 isoform X1 [Andrographis paniculata]XP_051147078.1 uncharacterized protein LOC127262443 isoform X1 [Andrographis paniculata]XP_051147079.1 uncharacterized protein LOC127262443 isoform X1 [Androg
MARTRQTPYVFRMLPMLRLRNASSTQAAVGGSTSNPVTVGGSTSNPAPAAVGGSTSNAAAGHNSSDSSNAENFKMKILSVNEGEGPFQILSMVGSFVPSRGGLESGNDGRLSTALFRPDGTSFGGIVAGPIIAASYVEIVLGCLPHDEGES